MIIKSMHFDIQKPIKITLSEQSASQAYRTKTPILKNEHSGTTDYHTLGYFDEHSSHKKTQDEAHWPVLSILPFVSYQR